jgi:hypothetical protein
MLGNTHLTTLNPGLDEKARTTVPGMANWSEPESKKKCGECAFWNDELNRKTARRCEKYSALMSDVRGPRIPSDTHACKFFVGVDITKGEPS